MTLSRSTITKKPIRTAECVNHLSGIICKPCDKNGPPAQEWRTRKDSNL